MGAKKERERASKKIQLKKAFELIERDSKDI